MLVDDEPLRLRVFIDTRIVEIFVNETAVRCGAGVSGTGRQRRRIAASAGLGRRPGIARRLADVDIYA